MQLVAFTGVVDTLQFVKVTRGSYGENLKRIRERRGLSQEEVARRLGTTRQGNLPAREKDPGVPRPQTVLRHAAALECEPWELLDGLVFPYDELRQKPDIEELARTVERQEETSARGKRRGK